MLQQKQYVPMLRTGIAEIGAYRSLYPSVKSAIFPIFQARPWPNANHFQLTVDRVVDAVQGNPFGFALDRERFGYANTKPAQREFDSLFDERRGFENYFDLVRSLPDAVPVLLPTRSAETLLHQIANADTLNRGLIIHQRRGAVIPLSDMILDLPPLPHDSVIIVDAGWSRDYLTLEAWAMPVAERIGRVLPNAEVVIMSSSFPESFSHIIGNVEEHGSERRLFSAARQRFNQADLTFGDWGSTRPQQGGGGGKIPSRVDVPKSGSWEIFRSDPDDDDGFHERAWEAQHHACFGITPDCWGKEMIKVTDDQGTGISSGQIATEARINIHMTVQSGAASILPFDEVPYQD